MSIDYYHAGMNAFDGRRFDEALEWFEKGSDDPRCHFAMAIMYYNGQGVERDFKKSTIHYEKAADKGILPALVATGFAYANAMGVPEDFDKAAHYLQQASDKGDMAAKITLAEIYAKGQAGGSRYQAAKMIREVLMQGSSEEAVEVYERYDLGNVKPTEQ